MTLVDLNRNSAQRVPYRHQDSMVGEADGDYDAARPAEGSAEGSYGEGSAGGLAVLYGSAGHEHGEGGKGADDDGIRKYLEHAEAALMHSGVVIRSGMGDRSGAKTGRRVLRRA